jgi:plasmid stability protein
VDAIAVFLAAPWGTPNLADGQPTYIPEMSTYLRRELKNFFNETPVSLHTNAGVAAFGTQTLFAPKPCLVCSVTGEVSELMRMDGMGVQAHATIPSGTHSLLRTLRAHGNMTEEEARSMLRLPLETDHPAREAARAAALEFSTHFKDAAKDLLSPGDVLRVRVLGHEPVGEWFARALASNASIAELFPDGGEVRAMHSAHLTPHIEAHAEVPDLLLLLEALFVDSRFNY